MGQDPASIVGPYVKPGMTILEPGPGMGFFTLEMAKRLGGSGSVIAVDVQSRMLDSLALRAAKAGVAPRIEPRLATSDSLGISDVAGRVDFVLAFAVVHEMPSAERFFAEAAQAMKPGALMLFAEPRGHIKPDTWASELAAAAKAGLQRKAEPQIRRSLAALLEKA
jgi:cyclopropane fatty-acyl-phospholipid synthase-like methyltransferase